MSDEFKGARIFLNIPAEIAHDPRIKRDKSVLLFGEIYSMLNVTGSFFMSNEQIAKRIRARSTRTVQNCLDELENLGYISRKVIRDPNTKAVIRREITSNWYPGASKCGRVMQQDAGGPCNQMQEGGASECTIKKQFNKTSNKTTKTNSASHSNALSVSQLEEEFEEVWSKYPNKKGKKQAFNHYKAWRKSSTKHTNEYLLERLKIYMVDLQKNSWKHPMNGSTWFNGRFDDELETENVAPANKYEQEGYYDDYKDFVRDDGKGDNLLDGVSDDELPF